MSSDVSDTIPTNTFVSAGDTFASVIDTFGDVDVFRTELAENLSYGFTVSTEDPDLDLLVDLLNSGGGLQSRQTATDGGDVEFSFTSGDTNNYFVRISDREGDDTGDYTLAINNADTILNSIASMTEVAAGSSIMSNIDVFGDVDVIKTSDLTLGLSYGFTVSTEDPDLDLLVDLLNSGGGLQSRQTATDGGDVEFSFTSGDTNNYFVRISDREGDDTGDYTLAINNADTILNSIASMTEVAAGSSIMSNIDVFGDVDVINTSDLTLGLSYGFTVSTEDPDLDLLVDLLNSGGGLQSRQAATDGGDVEFSFTSGDTNNYFVRISDREGDDTGDYTLAINNADTILNSIASMTEVAAGSSIMSNIDVFGDVDVIKTSDLTLGLSYGFTVSTEDPDLDLLVDLLNSGGGLQSREGATDGGDVEFSFTSGDTNNYFVRISDREGDDTGDYTLAINNDDTILNSIASTERFDVATCLFSAIDVLGDVDVVGVDLVAGVTYEFSTSTRSNTMDLLVDLLNSGGGLIARSSAIDGESASISFTATATDTFFLRVSDREGDDFGDYTLLATSGLNEQLNGNAGNNERHGGGGNDVISGFAGDDFLTGGADDDVLRGGLDNDLLDGGSGDDIIFGGDGDDTIDAGSGDDHVDAGNGNDTVSGGTGNDLLRGGQGNDILSGEAGADTLRGGAGNDNLRGDDGADVLSGSDGEDLLFGGAGNDLLLGDGQADVLNGGSGNDTLRGGGDNDMLFGDDDNDLLFGASGEDTLNGGDGDDTLDGGTQKDSLFGGNGNDVLRGGDGFDFLDGGSGNDILVGGNGNDTLVGGSGVDVLRGQANSDTFVFEDVSDSAFGSADLVDGMDGVGVNGGDVIDLSAIDANTGLAGNNSFNFLGVATTGQGLSQGAGALWLEDLNGITRVFGLINGDNTIDFAIRIDDGVAVTAADYTAADFLL